MYFISLFGASVLVMAQMVVGDYALTSPINAVWEAGSEKIITWTETGGSPTPATIDLALMSGPPTQLQLLSVIQQGIDSKSGQHKWLIPQELPAGKQYAIRSGAGPNVKYTPYFEIKSNIPAGSTFNAPSGGEEGVSPQAPTAKSSNKPSSGAILDPWSMTVVLPIMLSISSIGRDILRFY